MTPDGFAVRTLQPASSPHKAGLKAAELVPPQTQPHIGDRLDAKNLSWAWYSGGWAEALAGRPAPPRPDGEGGFVFHHQPFVYFKNLGDGTEAKARHLRDESDLFSALNGKDLPNVSFVKLPGTSTSTRATPTSRVAKNMPCRSSRRCRPASTGRAA